MKNRWVAVWLVSVFLVLGVVVLVSHLPVDSVPRSSPTSPPGDAFAFDAHQSPDSQRVREVDPLVEQTIAHYEGKTMSELRTAIDRECAIPKGQCRGGFIEGIVASAPDGGVDELQKRAREKDLDWSEWHIKQSATDRAKENAAARRAFAQGFDEALLQRHMNPDGVSTSGADSTTLQVNGWFCSRQFVYDETRGTEGDTLRAMGFKKISCSSAVQAWSADF